MRARLLVPILFLAALVCACGRVDRPPKVLVIGLDGVTWDLLDPWMAEGRLPRLKALRDEGAHGTLWSILPCLSPPAWTSAVTGVNPGKHGIFDFYRFVPDSLIAYQETGRSRRVPALWTLLSEADRRVGILNVPMSDPPDPVNGFLVSGFPHPDAKDFAHPPEVEAALVRDGYLLDRIGETLEDGKEQELYEEIVNTFRRRREAALRLCAEHPDLDLAWIVFTATDRMMHFYWRFMDPADPHRDPALAARFGTAIRDLYEEVDAAVGELVDQARAQAAAEQRELAILVLSDHGFAPVQRVFRPQSFLRHPPDGLPPITTTYSLDTNGTLLYVSVAGREKNGTLTPAEQEKVKDEILRRILGAVDPATGEKPAAMGARREDLFTGRYVDKAPDLLFVPRAPWTFIHEEGDKEPFGTPKLSFSAHHDPRGVLIVVGPMFRRGRVEGQATLIDIAPTVMYLAGAAVPGYMDGDVLAGWLTRDSLEKRPVVRDASEARETGSDTDRYKAIPYLQ